MVESGLCRSQPTFSPTGSTRSKQRWSPSARPASRRKPVPAGPRRWVAHLKLAIAKLKRERFAPSAERGKLLDQLELQLEELEASATRRRTRR